MKLCLKETNKQTMTRTKNKTNKNHKATNKVYLEFQSCHKPRTGALGIRRIKFLSGDMQRCERQLYERSYNSEGCHPVLRDPVIELIL